MKTLKIEKFHKQCSDKELWEFTEKELKLDWNPYPAYWTTTRKIAKKRQEGNILLAMDGKKIVGCLIAQGSHILILCVRHRYRRKGVGKALVRHIEGVWSQDKRRKAMTVDTFIDFNAKAFYEKLGFKVDNFNNMSYVWTMKKELSK